MVTMSFYNGTFKVDKAIELISDTNKEINYTYGFEYRGPTTYRVPIDKEKAIEIIKRNGFIDITEYEDWIHINEYSVNDMW